MSHRRAKDDTEDENNATINRLSADVIEDKFAIALLEFSVAIVMMQQFVRCLSRMNSKQIELGYYNM
jgi:hypothetical protein